MNVHLHDLIKGFDSRLIQSFVDESGDDNAEDAILRHCAGSDSQNHNSYGSEVGKSQPEEPTSCCNFDDRERRKAKKLFNSVLSSAQ